MGIRSERFSGKKLISQLDLLAGKEVQVILKGGNTFFGDLVEANKNKVVLKDKNARWYNRKLHTHNIALTEIREIIVDSQSPW